MVKLRRIGAVMMIIGLSLFIGVLVRDSTYMNSAPSSTIIPANSYYTITLPSHYRTEQIDIKVTTQNGSVQCLILINEYNVSKVIEHFQSQPTFAVSGNKSVEFTANYGTITMMIFNPGIIPVRIEYAIRAISYDYGALIMAASLTMAGIVTASVSHAWTQKKNTVD